MRRIIALVVLAGSLAVTGCLTADDRAQWGEALKDLRRENTEMKTIAPLSKKSE